MASIHDLSTPMKLGDETSSTIAPTLLETKAMYMQDDSKPGATKEGVIWWLVYYWIVLHALAVYAIVCIFMGQELLTGKPFVWQTYVYAAVLWFWAALGINCGSHRLWSHHSFEASWIVRVFLMLGATVQGTSIYMWATRHRVHHRYSDTAADPHDSTRGFFFCHIGWTIFKPTPEFKAALAEVDDRDLLADGVVAFQRGAGKFFVYGTCFIFAPAVAVVWGESLWNAVLLAGVLRALLGHHAVFFINSAAHGLFGHDVRPYDAKQAATDSPFVALVNIGEWHNYHHAFAFDYANAEMGALQQFNPSKMFLDFLAVFGLVWKRKRAHHLWNKKKELWEKQTGCKIVEETVGWPLFRQRKVVIGPQYDDEVVDGEDEKFAVDYAKCVVTDADVLDAQKPKQH